MMNRQKSLVTLNPLLNHLARVSHLKKMTVIVLTKPMTGFGKELSINPEITAIVVPIGSLQLPLSLKECTRLSLIMDYGNSQTRNYSIVSQETMTPVNMGTTLKKS